MPPEAQRDGVSIVWVLCGFFVVLSLLLTNTRDGEPGDVNGDADAPQ
jgi:hypothetical protein